MRYGEYEMESKLKRGQNVSETCEAMRRTTIRRTRIRYRHGVTIVWKADASKLGEGKEGIFEVGAASC
jgi:hypothetical protein